ncbi:MAG: hypothetical protein ABFD82_11140 [Syntrophaceae bacterium]
MAYNIENRGNYLVVTRDGKIQMRVYPTSEGPPPKRVGQASSGPDVEYTKSIAAQAVRYVRSQLPRGAFNNQMKIGASYKYLTNNVAPKWLAARAETMYNSLAFRRGDQPRDTITQMAARSLSTITVGGGVCSLMAYVTAGYLTTIAKRGTKIVTVFDGEFNHEYVVLYYGTSPYVVADPWVGTSYTCLWGHCYFPPESIHANTLMEIGETLEIPYGVEFTEQEVLTAKRIAGVDGIDNPPAKEKLDPSKQSLDQKKKYPWFHMDGAYGHPNNIKPEYEAKYRSVVMPEEWGNAVR